MAVIDDVRRLIQLDFMFLGCTFAGFGGATQLTNQGATWYKGRLQQANDGAIIFRSISQDGSNISRPDDA